MRKIIFEKIKIKTKQKMDENQTIKRMNISDIDDLFYNKYILAYYARNHHLEKKKYK